MSFSFFIHIFICTCSAGVKPGNIAAAWSKFIYLLYIFLLLSFVFVYVDAMPNEPEEEEELPLQESSSPLVKGNEILSSAREFQDETSGKGDSDSIAEHGFDFSLCQSFSPSTKQAHKLNKNFYWQFLSVYR